MSRAVGAIRWPLSHGWRWSAAGSRGHHRSTGGFRSLSLTNARRRPVWCWSSLTRQLRTSRMLIMPTMRPCSAPGRCRILRANMVEATSATLSPGEQVITALVIRAETGSACKSLLCTASPKATSRSEITPSAVLPSLLTMAAPMRFSRRHAHNVAIVSDGLMVMTLEPFAVRISATVTVPLRSEFDFRDAHSHLCASLPCTDQLGAKAKTVQGKTSIGATLPATRKRAVASRVVRRFEPRLPLWRIIAAVLRQARAAGRQPATGGRQSSPTGSYWLAVLTRSLAPASGSTGLRDANDTVLRNWAGAQARIARNSQGQGLLAKKELAGGAPRAMELPATRAVRTTSPA